MTTTPSSPKSNPVESSRSQALNQLPPLPETSQSFETSQPASQWQPLRWPRKLGVRAKATALAVTLSVVPVVVIGGTATYFANQIITERTLEEKEKVGVAVSLRLRDFVQKRLYDVEAIANAPFTTNPEVRAVTPPEAMIEFVDRFVEKDPTYAQIAAITPQGGFAPLENGRRFRDSAGTYSPEDDRQPDVFEAKNISYFLNPRETLRPDIAALRVSNQTGKSSFYVSVPSIDATTNRLAYVIYSKTDAEDISALINQYVANLLGEDADGSDAALQFRAIDHGKAYYERTPEGEEREIPSARIEISGNSVRIDGNEFQPGGDISTRENRIFVSNNDEGIGTEVQSIFPKYAELRQAGVAATVTDISQEDGQEYLLTYIPVPTISDLSFDWGVLVAQPTAIAFAPQRALTLSLLLGTGIAAITVGAIAAVVANRAARPIVTATDVVEKIGRGDLSSRLDFQGDDEIARLGGNIDNMAAQLQEFLEAKALEADQERLLIAARGTGAIRTADLQAIFDQTVASVRQVLKLDRVVIYRLNEQEPQGVISESVGPDLPSALQAGIVDDCIPQELYDAYRDGRIVAANDIAQADFNRKHLDLLRRLDVRSLLIVPIVGADRLFGLLIAHSCFAPRQWRETEINFLQRLGGELGLSAFWATLLEDTEELAEEQRQLKDNLQISALRLLQEVDPISRGNLTVRAKVTEDEIGTIADSYNATVESLCKIVRQVQEAASQVVSTTGNSENSVRLLSAEAARQAGEIFAALEQIQQMANAAQAVAVNAAQAEMAVQEAAQTVEEGDAAMNRTVDGMQSIRATVAETAKKVKHLGESSQKISTVIDLINAFAAQTNMLALNASIEASRAGEYGKGFAVVAEEVRTLARQSAEATEEIRKLVVSIQAETNEVVRAMEVGTEQVVMGTKLVDETRQSLNRITLTSTQIGQLVEAIAQATITQSETSETVTRSMEDIAAIATKTSTEVQSVSDSFTELRQVAQTLQDEVSRFKV
jgi:methyl-accepting chemotaxis protein PixJ